MAHRQPFRRQDSLAGLEPDQDKHDSYELSEADQKVADDYAAHFAEEKNVPLTDIQAVADELTLEEAREIIQNTVNTASTDPNFDQNLLRRAVDALKATDLSADAMKDLVEEIRLEAALIDDSPYLEVRSVVDNTDDPTIAVDTFRSWVLGLLLTTVGTGINMFFAPRYPGISVTASAAQVVAYPLAKLMEKTLPTKQWSMFGRQWSLNPGKFTMKEHMLITVMANVSFGTAYVTDVIFVLRLPIYFNRDNIGGNAGFQILVTMASQFLGFSMAGLTRRVLVYPPAMIWPANLGQVALNKSFHQEQNLPANGWTISRLKYFLILFTAYGLYYVIPNDICSFLFYFNWPTWIAPNNVLLTTLMGTYSGMGLNPWPSFDYTYWLLDPWVTPLFSNVNQFAGMLLGVPFILIVWFRNFYYTGYLPINASGIYDNTGASYNVSRILTASGTVNATLYDAYSPPYQTAGSTATYFFFFAAYLATMVWAVLHYHTEMWNGIKAAFKGNNSRDAYNDVHNRLMKAYPEVPEWWFGIVFVICFAMACVAVEIYDTQMPIWAVVLSCVLCLVFTIPTSIVMAVTNADVGLNVMAEMIGGYAFPGRPVANMLFKTFGYNTSAQASTYAQDLKLGHYCKIPPRSMFWAQTVATFWSSLVCLGVINWQINSIPDICQPDQIDKFTCDSWYTVFYAAAVQWGAIGPQRLYGDGAVYHPLLWGFFLGALAPIPVYFLARKYPMSLWKYVNVPTIFNGVLNYAPYNISYMVQPVMVAIVFQLFIRRRATAWWLKYNYITSVALSASAGIWAVIWFFALNYVDYVPQWWGNSVSYEGCEGQGGCTWYDLPETGYFGPGVGEFSFN